MRNRKMNFTEKEIYSVCPLMCFYSLDYVDYNDPDIIARIENFKRKAKTGGVSSNEIKEMTEFLEKQINFDEL